jgi:hypothetical protein
MKPSRVKTQETVLQPTALQGAVECLTHRSLAMNNDEVLTVARLIRPRLRAQAP